MEYKKIQYENPEHTLEDIKYLKFPDERYGASIHDHEIFMTFNNDCDTINFHDWWEAEGQELFINSLKHNLNIKDEN